jgi:hypothetical protein
MFAALVGEHVALVEVPKLLDRSSLGFGKEWKSCLS